jgi:hypothetical protein
MLKKLTCITFKKPGRCIDGAMHGHYILQWPPASHSIPDASQGRWTWNGGVLAPAVHKPTAIPVGGPLGPGGAMAPGPPRPSHGQLQLPRRFRAKSAVHVWMYA